MNIVVCIKQVPDTTEVKLDPKTGTLIREGVPSIINPDDKAGLEAALRLKDQYGAKVTVVSMGPPQADAALKKLDYDLIITGRQAIDGDTAQVGPQIAEHLGIPNISYAEDIKLEGDSIIVKRKYEDRYHIIKCKLPCLITALSELNVPRYMTPGRIFDAYRNEELATKVWGVNDVPVDTTVIGLKGSPTNVFKSFTKAPKAAGNVYKPDTAEEAAQIIVDKLQEKFIL